MIDLGGNGAFQIQTTKPVELDLQRSSAFFNLRVLFWKIVNRVELLHELGRNTTHSEDSLLFVKPSNKSALIVTAAPVALMALKMFESSWGVQFSVHGYTLGDVPSIG